MTANCTIIPLRLESDLPGPNGQWTNIRGVKEDIAAVTRKHLGKLNSCPPPPSTLLQESLLFAQLIDSTIKSKLQGDEDSSSSSFVSNVLYLFSPSPKRKFEIHTQTHTHIQFCCRFSMFFSRIVPMKLIKLSGIYPPYLSCPRLCHIYVRKKYIGYG
jgi:hypothetical protein